ncbi:MAG: hypothetical protein ABWY08_03145, partial [Comamonas sp.]
AAAAAPGEAPVFDIPRSAQVGASGRALIPHTKDAHFAASISEKTSCAAVPMATAAHCPHGSAAW